MSSKRARPLRCWAHYILTALKTWPGDSQLLHLVDQRGALQTEFDGCAFRTTDHPPHSFQRLLNQSPFGVAQRCCTWSDSGVMIRSCGGQRIGKHTVV